MKNRARIILVDIRNAGLKRWLCCCGKGIRTTTGFLLVTVKDMDESIRFYTDIVGLTVDSRRPAGPDLELAFLGDGETKLELIYNKTIPATSIDANISLGFEVASLEQTMAALEAKGILHSVPFQPAPQIRYLFITDPNGLKIQLLEHL